MEKWQYRDNEKILSKYQVKLVRQKEKSEEVDCLITEKQLVIDLTEVIKLPLSSMVSCDTNYPVDLGESHYHSPHDKQNVEPCRGTATIKYIDVNNQKETLLLDVRAMGLGSFNREINKQIEIQGIPSLGKKLSKGIKDGLSTAVPDLLRDRTRDKLCDGLRSLGIEVVLAERGRIEEKIFGSGSLGLIDISNSPIRWINIYREARGWGESRRTVHVIEFGIPDSRLGQNSNLINISTYIARTSLYRPKDVQWEGDDLKLGIINRLNNDTSLKYPIMQSGNLEIIANGQYGYWAISTEISIKKITSPSIELWNCYETITRYLLAEFSSNE